MEGAYVLHRRRYRESSLIVEFLTRDRGRLAAVARGALRPKSSLGSVLQPLVSLQIETRGRGELLTLTRAEADMPAPAVSGTRLYSVFYVNELLMRLTVVHDPLPQLYELYTKTIAALAGDVALEPCLRIFERDFLEILGLGLNLTSCHDDGAGIDPEYDYDYVADSGPARATVGANGKRVSGRTLLALAGETDWQEQQTREAKQLMRYILDHHLDGRPLAAREFFAPPSSR